MQQTSTIRIGTRGSQLALWQAHHVQDLLQAAGAQTQIVIIETKGDKVLDVALSKIGSKGVFTQEIEDQLQAGQIDIAVHSAKDMPSTLPPGFSLIAFGQREQEHDVLVSQDPSLKLDSGQPYVIGTSSTRRVATLKHHYPHIKVVDMRGNLQTRWRKLTEGACQGMLLAYAGVHRMGWQERIAQHLDTTVFTPAVGQGSVAIEVFKNLPQEKAQLVRQAINHEPTEQRLLAERAYLRTLEGGCSIPAFALATLQGTKLSLHAGIIDLEGTKKIAFSHSGSASQAQQIGHDLGQKVLTNGGAPMLARIKAQLNS